MGMLFRSVDTDDLLERLNNVFNDEGFVRLRNPPPAMGHRKNKVKQLLKNGRNDKSSLAVASTLLGIWPTKTPRGKGRWMTFLRELHEQDGNHKESQEHERIRNQIYSWIYDNGSPITSIYFDTTEIGAGNKKSADIQVVNTQGRILLNTPIHRADDLGEENDGAE